LTASTSIVTRRRILNRLFGITCLGVTAIALIALAAILWTLVSRGIGGLELDVFRLSTPAPGSHGGLANAIVGSIMLCVIAMALATVIGVLAGTWLAEYGQASRYGSVIRFLNDVLLSAPSILVGLFVYEVLVYPFHTFSAVAGAAALALLAVPVITRSTEDVLRLQPSALRESGVALGAQFSLVVRQILWPSARNGILTAALLAFARISGETAPLLFTALNNQFLSLDPRHPIANLPSVIFQFALSPYDDWRRLAWVGALLIALTVLTVTIVARLMAQEPRRS
jgi:phosphate transport system permease protein